MGLRVDTPLPDERISDMELVYGVLAFLALLLVASVLGAALWHWLTGC